eukprot:30294-Pelagococcus_subviridis.AAC.100
MARRFEGSDEVNAAREGNVHGVDVPQHRDEQRGEVLAEHGSRCVRARGPASRASDTGRRDARPNEFLQRERKTRRRVQSDLPFRDSSEEFR